MANMMLLNACIVTERSLYLRYALNLSYTLGAREKVILNGDKSDIFIVCFRQSLTHRR